MIKVQYIKSHKKNNAGDVETVSNNVAHGLVEKGIAILYRNKLMESPVDKMLRSEEKPKTYNKRRSYKTK